MLLGFQQEQIFPWDFRNLHWLGKNTLDCFGVPEALDGPGMWMLWSSKALELQLFLNPSFLLLYIASKLDLIKILNQEETAIWFYLTQHCVWSPTGSWAVTAAPYSSLSLPCIPFGILTKFVSIGWHLQNSPIFCFRLGTKRFPYWSFQEDFKVTCDIWNRCTNCSDNQCIWIRWIYEWVGCLIATTTATLLGERHLNRNSCKELTVFAFITISLMLDFLPLYYFLKPKFI